MGMLDSNGDGIDMGSSVVRGADPVKDQLHERQHLGRLEREGEGYLRDRILFSIRQLESRCKKNNIPLDDIHIVMSPRAHYDLRMTDRIGEYFQSSPERHDMFLFGYTWSLCENIGDDYKLTILLKDI